MSQENEFLMPAFQPIVDKASGRFPAAEVLARWNKGGVLSTPAEVGNIDWAMVDVQTAQIIRGNADLGRLFYSNLFLNVSEELLESDTTFKQWLDVTGSTINGRKLKVVIEITEDIPERLLKKRWYEIKNLGAAFALDDFGDKHSNFKRLADYPWDYCKFNAKKVVLNESFQAVLYCADKGIKCISEQVESEAQSKLSSKLGLSLQQGFHLQTPKTLPEHIHKIRADHEKRNRAKSFQDNYFHSDINATGNIRSGRGRG